jgi:AraC-like DNA-binding protein
MSENLFLIISSLATFSLALLSVLSLKKAKENKSFLWLSLLFISPAIAILNNTFIYMNAGSIILFHLSFLFNLSWGGYLILVFNPFRTRQKLSFNIWLFFPSALYLPFIVYSIINPVYIRDIVKGADHGIPFLISSVYNVIIVVYSLWVNVALMITETKKRKISPQHRVRAEILIIMLILQTSAFIPFILKLDIEYIILYMPVFGQIFFLYLFFRLPMEKAVNCMNPDLKKKYSSLNTNSERLNEIENKILHVVKGKKLFLSENCTLQLLANEVNESSHSISMIINSRYNKSFPDFINQFRIEKAIDLLQSANYNMTIEGIAFECGFGNKTSFYKAFKKETGKLPSEFLPHF